MDSKHTQEKARKIKERLLKRFNFIFVTYMDPYTFSMESMDLLLRILVVEVNLDVSEISTELRHILLKRLTLFCGEKKTLLLSRKWVLDTTCM